MLVENKSNLMEVTNWCNELSIIWLEKFGDTLHLNTFFLFRVEDYVIDVQAFMVLYEMNDVFLVCDCGFFDRTLCLANY